MAKYILLVSVFLLPLIAVSAQDGSDTLIRPGLIYAGNAPLKTAIIDSLNSRNGGVTISPLGDSRQLNARAATRFAAYIGDVGGKRMFNKQLKAYQITKDTSRLSGYLDTKLRGFYALRAQSGLSTTAFHGPLKVELSGITTGIVADNSPGAVNGVYGNASIAGTIALKGIPFDVQYNHISGGNGVYPGIRNGGLIKTGFDREAYLNNLSAGVKDNYDLNKYFLSDIDLKAAMKAYSDQGLNRIKSDMAATFKGQLPEISAEEFLQLDSTQLKNLVISRAKELDADSTEKVSGEYLKRLQQLKGEMGNEHDIRQDLYGNYDVKQQAAGYINNEEHRIAAAKELLPLNGLQKMFLYVKDLRGGAIGVDGGKGTAKDLFMNGAAGSMLKDDRFIMLGAGSRDDNAGLRNTAFSSSLMPSNYAMQFAQLGKGDIAAAHTHVGAVNASTRQVSGQQLGQALLPRNTFTGSIEKQLDLGEYGVLSGMVSKSNSVAGGGTAADGSVMGAKVAALGIMDDFWSTFSAGISYAGDIESWRLSPKVYVDYAGLGYSNPASPYGTRGSWRYGMQLKKRLQQNRLIIGARIDRKDMHTSPVYNSKWQSTLFGFDAKYKLDKYITLDARYRQSAMVHSGGKDTIGGSDFITRQLNLGSRIRSTILSKPANSNVILSFQQMDYRNALSPLKSLLVNVGITQTMVFKTNVLAVNLFYNKDLKDNALYNNLFTADASWNYRLTENTSCSSGLTWLSNEGVVKQAGLKQSIQTSLSSRLSLSGYADCRTNLYNTAQNYLFGTFRGEVSLNYSLNKNVR